MTKGQFTPVSTEESGQTRKGSTHIKKIAIAVVVIVLVILVIVVIAGVVVNLTNTGTSDDLSGSMSYEPNIDNKVVFEQGRPSSVDKYITKLRFLQDDYEQESQMGENVADCTNDSVRPPGKACKFDLDLVGPNCVWQNTYGYDDGMPCIFLSLHMKEDLVPELSVNSSMPPEVRERFQAGYIPVSCEGVNEADKENVSAGSKSRIAYWPSAGFPVYFFPAQDLEEYKSPLVAVQFQRPRNGVAINIECRVWADNVDASVQFQLLVD